MWITYAQLIEKYDLYIILEQQKIGPQAYFLCQK